MAHLVNEDVVGFDIAKKFQLGLVGRRARSSLPVDEAEGVDSLNGKDTLGYVELADVFRECIVFDQPATLAHEMN